METTPEVVQKFLEALPHARALGMRVLLVSPGEVELVLPYDARLIGDPSTGVIAGGAVSTLMDTSGGAAVICHPKTQGTTATLGLRIDYMRAAKPEQSIRAVATCYHVTRNVAFVRATAYDDDPDRPVAAATGSFTVDRMRSQADGA